MSNADAWADGVAAFLYGSLGVASFVRWVCFHGIRPIRESKRLFHFQLCIFCLVRSVEFFFTAVFPRMEDKNTTKIVFSRLATCAFFCLISYVTALWANVINPSRSNRSKAVWTVFALANAAFFMLVLVVTIVALQIDTSPVVLDLPLGMTTIGTLVALLLFVRYGLRIKRYANQLPVDVAERFKASVNIFNAGISVCALLFGLRTTIFVLSSIRAADSSADTMITAQCGPGMTLCNFLALWLPELVTCLFLLLLMTARPRKLSVYDDGYQASKQRTESDIVNGDTSDSSSIDLTGQQYMNGGPDTDNSSKTFLHRMPPAHVLNLSSNTIDDTPTNHKLSARSPARHAADSQPISSNTPHANHAPHNSTSRRSAFANSHKARRSMLSIFMDQDALQDLGDAMRYVSKFKPATNSNQEPLLGTHGMPIEEASQTEGSHAYDVTSKYVAPIPETCFKMSTRPKKSKRRSNNHVVFSSDFAMARMIEDTASTVLQACLSVQVRHLFCPQSHSHTCVVVEGTPFDRAMTQAARTNGRLHALPFVSRTEVAPCAQDVAMQTELAFYHEVNAFLRRAKMSPTYSGNESTGFMIRRDSRLSSASTRSDRPSFADRSLSAAFAASATPPETKSKARDSAPQANLGQSTAPEETAKQPKRRSDPDVRRHSSRWNWPTRQAAFGLLARVECPYSDNDQETSVQGENNHQRCLVESQTDLKLGGGVNVKNMLLRFQVYAVNDPLAAEMRPTNALPKVRVRSPWIHRSFLADQAFHSRQASSVEPFPNNSNPPAPPPRPQATGIAGSSAPSSYGSVPSTSAPLVSLSTSPLHNSTSLLANSSGNTVSSVPFHQNMTAVRPTLGRDRSISTPIETTDARHDNWINAADHRKGAHDLDIAGLSTMKAAHNTFTEDPNSVQPFASKASYPQGGELLPGEYFGSSHTDKMTSPVESNTSPVMRPNSHNFDSTYATTGHNVAERGSVSKLFEPKTDEISSSKYSQDGSRSRSNSQHIPNARSLMQQSGNAQQSLTSQSPNRTSREITSSRSEHVGHNEVWIGFAEVDLKTLLASPTAHACIPVWSPEGRVRGLLNVRLAALKQGKAERKLTPFLSSPPHTQSIFQEHFDSKYSWLLHSKQLPASNSGSHVRDNTFKKTDTTSGSPLQLCEESKQNSIQDKVAEQNASVQESIEKTRNQSYILAPASTNDIQSASNMNINNQQISPLNTTRNQQDGHDTAKYKEKLQNNNSVQTSDKVVLNIDTDTVPPGKSTTRKSRNKVESKNQQDSEDDELYTASTVNSSSAFGGRMTRWYSFTNARNEALIVEEDLRESVYCFDVPAKMLSVLYQEKLRLLNQTRHELEKMEVTSRRHRRRNMSDQSDTLSNDTSYSPALSHSQPNEQNKQELRQSDKRRSQYAAQQKHRAPWRLFDELVQQIRDAEERKRAHAWLSQYSKQLETNVTDLETFARLGERGIGPNGITFKRSTAKAEASLKYLPTNLHLQEMRVRHLGPASQLPMNEAGDRIGDTHGVIISSHNEPFYAHTSVLPPSESFHLNTSKRNTYHVHKMPHLPHFPMSTSIPENTEAIDDATIKTQQSNMQYGLTGLQSSDMRQEQFQTNEKPNSFQKNAPFFVPTNEIAKVNDFCTSNRQQGGLAQLLNRKTRHTLDLYVGDLWADIVLPELVYPDIEPSTRVWTMPQVPVAVEHAVRLWVPYARWNIFTSWQKQLLHALHQTKDFNQRVQLLLERSGHAPSPSYARLRTHSLDHLQEVQPNSHEHRGLLLLTPDLVAPDHDMNTQPSLYRQFTHPPHAQMIPVLTGSRPSISQLEQALVTGSKQTRKPSLGTAKDATILDIESVPQSKPTSLYSTQLQSNTIAHSRNDSLNEKVSDLSPHVDTKTSTNLGAEPPAISKQSPDVVLATAAPVQSFSGLASSAFNTENYPHTSASSFSDSANRDAGHNPVETNTGVPSTISHYSTGQQHHDETSTNIVSKSPTNSVYPGAITTINRLSRDADTCDTIGRVWLRFAQPSTQMIYQSASTCTALPIVEMIYDTVTVGAFAAHSMGFRDQGLRQMHAQLRALHSRIAQEEARVDPRLRLVADPTASSNDLPLYRQPHTPSLWGRLKYWFTGQKRSSQGEHLISKSHESGPQSSGYLKLLSTASGFQTVSSQTNTHGTQSARSSYRSRPSLSRGESEYYPASDIVPSGTANGGDTDKSHATSRPAVDSTLDLQYQMRKAADLSWEISQREDVVLCQAVTALVTSFARKIRLLQRYMHPSDGRKLLCQFQEVGYLFCVESLLSTYANELGMLGDFSHGVAMLRHFRFRLVPPRVSHTYGTKDSHGDLKQNEPSRKEFNSSRDVTSTTLLKRSDDWRAGDGGAIRIIKEDDFYTIELRMWPMHSVPHQHAKPTKTGRTDVSQAPNKVQQDDKLYSSQLENTSPSRNSEPDVDVDTAFGAYGTLPLSRRHGVQSRTKSANASIKNDLRKSAIGNRMKQPNSGGIQQDNNAVIHAKHTQLNSSQADNMPQVDESINASSSFPAMPSQMARRWMEAAEEGRVRDVSRRRPQNDPYFESVSMLQSDHARISERQAKSPILQASHVNSKKGLPNSSFQLPPSNIKANMKSQNGRSTSKTRTQPFVLDTETCRHMYGDTFTELVPLELLNGAYIYVTPVIFTQGINEKQTLSNINYFHSSYVLQNEINQESFQQLLNYWAEYKVYYQRDSYAIQSEIDSYRFGKRGRRRWHPGSHSYRSESKIGSWVKHDTEYPSAQSFTTGETLHGTRSSEPYKSHPSKNPNMAYNKETNENKLDGTDKDVVSSSYATTARYNNGMKDNGTITNRTNKSINRVNDSIKMNYTNNNSAVPISFQKTDVIDIPKQSHHTARQIQSNNTQATQGIASSFERPQSIPDIQHNIIDSDMYQNTNEKSYQSASFLSSSPGIVATKEARPSVFQYENTDRPCSSLVASAEPGVTHPTPNSIAALEAELERRERKLQRLDEILNEVFRLLRIKRSKQIEILRLVAEFARRVHAGRVVSCKSAKDRTSMSVTLEQARLLREEHGLVNMEIGSVVELMRRHGVRRLNAEKNIGRAQYAFNPIQSRFLPAEYRPPVGTGGTGFKS